MRILIAIGVHRQEEAGAAAVVLNHARELIGLGHEVECWFLDDVLDGPARAPRFETLRFANAVKNRILRERDRFDVVNLHAPWGCIYGIWRRVFGATSSPPYVMTMQGSEERYSTAMKIENRKGRAWHFALKNRIWHRLYHQNTYWLSIKSADYGVVANREGWALTELKYGRAPGRMWFLPNGVEESFFISREYTERQALRLLYVGTWLDRKGVYYLAEAFLLAARKLPGITLTVAGCLASEEVVRGYFPEEVRGQLKVIPYVGRKDMKAVYAEHDIFVFPSLVEGMPLTLLEAMATGMPVVTTNTCGMADVVEDGINGILVAPADAKAVAAAIERLSQSVELQARLGQAGQNTMTSYTWKRVGQRLDRVLRLAVEGR